MEIIRQRNVLNDNKQHSFAVDIIDIKQDKTKEAIGFNFTEHEIRRHPRINHNPSYLDSFQNNERQRNGNYKQTEHQKGHTTTGSSTSSVQSDYYLFIFTVFAN